MCLAPPEFSIPSRKKGGNVGRDVRPRYFRDCVISRVRVWLARFRFHADTLALKETNRKWMAGFIRILSFYEIIITPFILVSSPIQHSNGKVLFQISSSLPFLLLSILSLSLSLFTLSTSLSFFTLLCLFNSLLFLKTGDWVPVSWREREMRVEQKKSKREREREKCVR